MVFLAVFLREIVFFLGETIFFLGKTVFFLGKVLFLGKMALAKRAARLSERWAAPDIVVLASTIIIVDGK